MPDHFHHVPGRLRVHVPSTKGNPSEARFVAVSISQLQGIISAEGRPVTGSVVIHYDTAVTNLAALLNALNLDCSPCTQTRKPLPQPSNGSSGIAAKAAKMVAGYALDKAVERGIPLLLGALL